MMQSVVVILCFFFHDTATSEIYTYLHTLSLHDALPIAHLPEDAGPEGLRQDVPALRRSARRSAQSSVSAPTGRNNAPRRRQARSLPKGRYPDNAHQIQIGRAHV